jgi:hypothetical protein
MITAFFNIEAMSLQKGQRVVSASGIVEQGIVEQGIVEQGIVEQGILDQSTTLVYNGLSGYPTSASQVQNIINVMNSNRLNTYRMCFNPEWFSGKLHPYNPNYIQYFLNHCNYSIIVDRNHLWIGGSSGKEGSAVEARANWSTVRDSVFQVLRTWPNNQRVMVELINEYVSADFYTRMQSLVNEIRSAGYTNPIVANKWDQPWTMINDPLNNTYQGYHYYFNSWSPSGAISNIKTALSKGIKLINTEIGADYRESSYFTSSTVAELSSYLSQCSSLGVGNTVWMNENLGNWPRYEELNLTFQ